MIEPERDITPEEDDIVEGPRLGSFRRRSTHIFVNVDDNKNDDHGSGSARSTKAQKNWAKLRQAVLTRATLETLLADARQQRKENALEQTKSQEFTKTTWHPRNVGDFTVVAFINSGSGGGKGEMIYRDLVEHLGPDRVFNLKDCRKGNMPEDNLLEFALDPKVRVLACGGDGTMGWIESSIDKVWVRLLGPNVSVEHTPYASHLPLALMPLGTGNDLSRTFGWGKTFKDKMRQKRAVMRVSTAAPSMLDRWRCVILPACKLDEESRKWVPQMLGETTTSAHSQDGAVVDLFDQDDCTKSQEGTAALPPNISENSEEMQVFDGVFCNYLSIGFDAEVACSFHHSRQKNPGKFSSPLKNKMIYVRKSRVALSSPVLTDKVKVLVSDPETQKLVNLPVPVNCRCIVLMNIQSYAGGNKIAVGGGKPDDGLIEVIFVSGVAQMAAAAVTPLKCHIAAQTDRVCIQTSKSLYCQVDGEPWLQSKAYFQISHYSRSAFLRKVKPSCIGGCRSTSAVVE